MKLEERAFRRGAKKHTKEVLDQLSELIDRTPPTDEAGTLIDRQELRDGVTEIVDFNLHLAYLEANRKISIDPADTEAMFGTLVTMLLLCDYRNWRASAEDHAVMIFRAAVVSPRTLARMEAFKAKEALQAWGAISSIYFRVMRSTGREVELMTAVQRYSGTQL